MCLLGREEEEGKCAPILDPSSSGVPREARRKEPLNFQANSLWGRVREEEPVPGAPAWNCCAHGRCWPCVDQTIRCGGGVGSSPLPSGAPLTASALL